MGFNGTRTDTATTPGRRTHLILDPEDLPVLKEGVISYRRIGREMARGGFGPNNSSNVQRMGNGAIALKPIQTIPGQLAETAAGASLVMGTGDFDFPVSGMFQARARFRQKTELPGMTYNASVASSGDNFLARIVSAGISWAQTLASHQTAFGSVPISPYANVPMDRVGVGRVTYGADKGYCWRFEVNGTQIDSRQMLGSFYFGGPVADGYVGRYGLALDGTGVAILFEQTGQTTWTDVHAFRYAAADRIAGTVHQIIIRPYMTPSASTAGYIDFNVHQSDAAPSLVSQYFQEPTKPHVSVYIVKRRSNPAAPPRDNVTGAGNVWFDTPRDARHYHQFSRLGFPSTGHFVDYPFAVPFYIGTTQNLTLSWKGSVPSGCTLVGKLYNAATGGELTLVSSTDTSRTYNTPAGLTHLQVRFDYTSDGEDSPALYSYRCIRNGVLATPTVTEVEPTHVMEVSLTGGEADPSHETSHFVIEDLKDELTKLKTRGRIPYRLTTQYDPADSTKRSVLSEGFLLKPQRMRHRSKKKEGLGGGGSTRAYPAQRWSQYLCTGVGNWMRLAEKFSWQLFDQFISDPNAPDLPWKVTDVVAYLLNYCGYPFEMLDIPDASMRLFTQEGQPAEDAYTVVPGQNFGDIILKLLRDYLGWALVWDGNAGDRGMWRAIAPNLPPYTNRAVFRTAQSSTGKLANHAGAYGNAAAGYYSESGSVTGFIKERSLVTYTKPPEANAVLVIGGGEDLPNSGGHSILMQWLVNRDGGDFFPGYTVDPDNPDYIGELVPLLYLDKTLNTQAAVDYMAWRLFHTTCHGIRMARFEAPLLLVTDPDDDYQEHPRPLRYYDAAQINDDGEVSQWLVRNVNPVYSSDLNQMAIYEMEAPREPYA